MPRSRSARDSTRRTGAAGGGAAGGGATRVFDRVQATESGGAINVKLFPAGLVEANGVEAGPGTVGTLRARIMSSSPAAPGPGQLQLLVNNSPVQSYPLFPDGESDQTIVDLTTVTTLGDGDSFAWRLLFLTPGAGAVVEGLINFEFTPAAA